MIGLVEREETLYHILNQIAKMNMKMKDMNSMMPVEMKLKDAKVFEHHIDVIAMASIKGATIITVVISHTGNGCSPIASFSER